MPAPGGRSGRRRGPTSLDASASARRVQEVRKRIRRGGYDTNEVLEALVKRILEQVSDKENRS